MSRSLLLLNRSVRSAPPISSLAPLHPLRHLTTSLPQRADKRPGLDPLPSSPDSVQHVPPADVVAHAQTAPPTEYATPQEITAETVSGAPNELLHRQVRIYRPTKTTMQSGKGKTKRWLIDWDVLPGAGRWENDLMGWASSADYMQGTVLAFRTREDAVAFAEKQGWDYMVQEPKEPKIPPKNYASNYVYIPGKLRIHHTK